MKKLIGIILGTALLFSTSAHSDGMIGIKVGVGDLEATKAAYTAGSNSYAAETRSKDHEYGAVFAELNIPTVDGLSLGFEIIPFTATIMLDNEKEAQTGAEISDYRTLYGQYMYSMANGGIYVKAGYSMGDIGAVSQTGTSSTTSKTVVNSQSDSLEGPMIGLGFQSSEFGDGFVARAEATYTEFDDVSVTTTSNGSTSVKKTASAELTTFSVSLAKTF